MSELPGVWTPPPGNSLAFAAAGFAKVHGAMGRAKPVVSAPASVLVREVSQLHSRAQRYRARTASSRLDPVPNMKPVARPLATSKAKRLLAPSTNV
jgi:hypothetical protein